MAGQLTPPLQGANLPQDDSFVSSDADDCVVYELSCEASTTDDGQELMLVNKDFMSTPKADASNMYDMTPKADKNRMFDATPKAGTSNRNRHATTLTAGKDNDRTYAAHSTPSWDIDNAFFFRKKDEKKEYTRDNKQRIQSSSGLKDLFSLTSLSLSKSVDMKDDEDDEDDESPESRLTEAAENDLFAMDVGLMFSADEGDTINDPRTLHSQATISYTLNTLESSDNSADHSRVYDVDIYRIQNGVGRQSDDSTKGDRSIFTANCSTVLDDHGNKIPENAKMILGYDNAKRLSQHNQTNQAFPTVQTPDAPSEEMERRIRELAGQISADWRGPDLMPPTLARRLRDFQFAREKRRKKYGKAQPWGIMGLYNHLSNVKIDVEWAEDAAWRRANKQPYLSWGDFEVMKSEGFNRPFFTYLTVMACTAMMFMSIYVNDWGFEPLSVNPMIGPSAETLLRLGAKNSYLIVMQHDISRLVSPMVLHAGLIHYVLNMLALWFVGKAVEEIHGFFSIALIFIVSAIGGIILSAIFLPEYITVGASGGIFGLIGACISDIIMNWNLFFNKFVNERGARLSHARVLMILFLDIVLNCAIGLTPFIDNFTHLGGMIYGFLCGLSTIHIISPRFFGDDSHRCHNCKLFSFRSIGLLVCTAGIVASSFVLFSGDGKTNPCTTCTKISCVTFPPWADSEEKWWYCDDCGRATANATLNTETGEFLGLSLNCPDGTAHIVGMDDSLSNADEAGLEVMLPTLCREYCILKT